MPVLLTKRYEAIGSWGAAQYERNVGRGTVSEICVALDVSNGKILVVRTSTRLLELTNFTDRAMPRGIHVPYIMKTV